MTSTQPSLIPVPPTEDSADVWLLKRRHEDMSTMFRTCWDLYIKFYTVFLTFSVAAMGWLLARDQNNRVPPKVFHVIAVVLIAQSLLTATTSAAMAFYSRRVARDHIRLENAVLGSAPVQTALIETSAVPVALATWSGWANAVAMLGMCYAWWYIAFSMYP